VNAFYKQGQLKYLEALAEAQKSGKPMTQKDLATFQQKSLKDTVSALTKLLDKFSKEELAVRGINEEDIVTNLMTNMGIMQGNVYGGIRTRE
jgi:DNA-binding MarR family transcriptional regulator